MNPIIYTIFLKCLFLLYRLISISNEFRLINHATCEHFMGQNHKWGGNSLIHWRKDNRHQIAETFRRVKLMNGGSFPNTHGCVVNLRF